MNIEKLKNRFRADYGTLKKVDRSFLLHHHYSEEEIEALIEAQVLEPITPYDKDGAFANEIAYLIKL